MKRFILSVAAATSLALPALAGDAIQIVDPYARASHAMAQSGAAFMRILNHGDMDRRIIAARSDVAERVELHTHIEDDQGIMRMVEVEDGFTIPADGEYVLGRGGDHIMFLGLRQPLTQGDEIIVTLVFEQGDDMQITIPVDMERMPDHGAAQSHSHDHSHSHSHDHSHSHSHD